MASEWLSCCFSTVFICPMSDMLDAKVHIAGCRHETTANALRYSRGMSVLTQGAAIAKADLRTVLSYLLNTVCQPCSFALYLLARHPAALEQLLHEVDTFGRTRVRALNWLLSGMPTKLPWSSAFNVARAVWAAVMGGSTPCQMGLLHPGPAVHAFKWLPPSGQQQPTCCRRHNPTQ